MKKVNIKGAIIRSNDQWIYDWFGMEATSPKSVNDALSQYNGEDLEVEINSGGGDVFAGSEIYTALKSYTGKVTVKIVGIAASAASVIAMAGDRVLMSPTAQMMIHNVSANSQGDYRDMERSAEVLKNANQTIANAYMIKSGRSSEELLDMMDKETWMTAQQALENKLIDEVMFIEGAKMVAGAFSNQMIPDEVLNKIRNTINNPAAKGESDFLMQKNKATLRLLSMKGETDE